MDDPPQDAPGTDDDENELNGVSQYPPSTDEDDNKLDYVLLVGGLHLAVHPDNDDPVVLEILSAQCGMSTSSGKCRSADGWDVQDRNNRVARASEMTDGKGS